MILVLIVGGVMGWKARRAILQRQAVAAFRTSNASHINSDNIFMYDFQRLGAAEPPGPAWLRRLVGDEYFQEIWYVRLESDEAMVMAAVGQLDRLEYLEIRDLNENPGNALAEIGKLKRLQELVLYVGELSLRDEMLAALDGLPELTKLSIFDADLGDAGLTRLGHLPKLESLVISSRGNGSRLMTDVGLEAVARSMPELRELDLYESDVTDAGLAALGRLSKLTDGRLCGPRVTDAGLAHLSNLLSPKATAGLQAARPSLTIYPDAPITLRPTNPVPPLTASTVNVTP